MFNYEVNPYGNFRTKTFSDIFPDFQTFQTEWNECPLHTSEITDENVKIIFYELYARYGNSHIASSDQNQFKFKLWSIILNRGSVWQKHMETQAKLRALTDNDIKQVRNYVTSQASNPGEGGETANEDNPQEIFLSYINAQTQNRETAAPIQALTAYMTTIIDITTVFINEFKVLFLNILQPYSPLYYSNGGND